MDMVWMGALALLWVAAAALAAGLWRLGRPQGERP